MSGTLRNCLLVAVAAAAAVLPGAQPAAAIANGEDARPGAYPFTVLLTMTGLPADDGGTRDSSCSGALIASRWVITAGHCFRDSSGQRVSRTVAERTTAVIGRTEINSVAGYEADVIAVHQAGHTDVALAELAADVPGITPIRLATTAPEPGEVLRLAGFGLVTGPGGTAPPQRLQTGRFLVGAVGDTLVEASGHAPRADTSPCPHDSGGPYFREAPGHEPALVAIVSTGPGCPHPGPDMSARVDNLADWIAGTTATRTGPPWNVIATVAVLAIAGLLGGLTLARRGRSAS